MPVQKGALNKQKTDIQQIQILILQCRTQRFSAEQHNISIRFYIYIQVNRVAAAILDNHKTACNAGNTGIEKR